MQESQSFVNHYCQNPFEKKSRVKFGQLIPKMPCSHVPIHKQEFLLTIQGVKLSKGRESTNDFLGTDNGDQLVFLPSPGLAVILACSSAKSVNALAFPADCFFKFCKSRSFFSNSLFNLSISESDLAELLIPALLAPLNRAICSS